MKNIAFITLLIVSMVSFGFSQEKPDGSENIISINPNFEEELLKLVNIERKKYGLNELRKDEDLMRCARYHAWDMAIHDYYDHATMKKSNNGEWEVVYFKSSLRIRKFLSKSPRCTAENIAAGQRTPKEVMESWMDSPGHRSNILNPEFSHIGVGYYEPKEYRYKSPHYWVQDFKCEF